MLPRKGILVFSLVFSLLDTCSSQSICTAVQQSVVRYPNGTLGFPPLPPAPTADVDFTYDAGALGGWYNLANSFADAVRSGSLPYDLIQESVNESNLACDIIEPQPAACVSSQSDFDALRTVRDFATWWVPILVVCCLGGVLAIAFLITGCVFWCCRCCGNCGGGRKQTESNYMDGKTFVFTSILLALTIVLLVGVILAFFSNEKSFDSLENFQSALLVAADDAIEYTENGLEQGDSLACQFNDVATITINDARTVQSDLRALTDDFQQQANAIFETLTNLSSGLSQQSIDNITTLLTNISMSTSNLQSQGMMLESDLNTISMDISTLETNCMGMSPAIMDACTAAIGSINIAAAVDFSQLPNVTQELADVQNSDLGNFNLLQDIDEGRDQITTDTQAILDEIDMQLNDAIAEVERINQTIFDRWIGDIRGNISRFIQDDQNADDCPGLSNLNFDNDVDVGYIRECVINEVFDNVQRYDRYRYGFGVAVCSLALVAVVLVGIGIVLGVFGFRRDMRPYQRTRLSHCGGIFLLVAVGLMFLFGFLLLILSAIMFFFGANAVKSCNAIEFPNYELYVRVVDNNTLWGGSLIGSNAFGNASEVFSLSQALLNCEDDVPLYSALNLSNLINLTNEFVVTEDFVDGVRNDVTTAAMSFLDNYDPGDFLQLNVQDNLTQFADANLDNINISAFREQINSELLQFDIDQTIMDLQALALMAPSLATDINNTIMELENLQMNRIPAIQTELGQLEMDVNELDMLIDTLLINTSNVADDVNVLANNLTAESLNNTLNEIAIEPLDTIIDFTIQFIDHFSVQIENEVARCRPLWGIYTGVYNSVCRDVLDGWNGAWWSLGFCALFFIPIIIFSIITSNFYLRKKYFEYDDSYTDHPLKAF